MKKRTYLRIISCLFLTLCTLFVMFTACTETGGDKTNEPSTAEPSSDVYADPTEKATLTPITLAPFTLPPVTTECPTPPAETTHDVEMLRAFFDTPSKVEGKTNGQLLYKDYDSANPHTWYVHDEVEHIKYMEYCKSLDYDDSLNNDDFIIWTGSWGGHREYSGEVDKIMTYVLEYENKILNFGGTLLFDGFESLRSIELCNITADELIIENCVKLEYVSIYIDLEKSNHFFEKVYINARIGSNDIYPCAKEFRLVVPAPEWKRDFDITALADGDGIVSVNLEYDTHYPNVVIYAEAAGGSHFAGWYDEEGHLVSERERFMLTDYDYFDLFNDIATYTARFEKD